jgi:hypothetical protein
MDTKKQRNVNIATIVVLFLIAYSTSPEPIKEMIVFVSLLLVVFGRDLLLRKPGARSREQIVA